MKYCHWSGSQACRFRAYESRNIQVDFYSVILKISKPFYVDRSSLIALIVGSYTLFISIRS